jgi:hypothetical protein
VASAFVTWLSGAGRWTVSGVDRPRAFLLAKSHRTTHELFMTMTTQSTNRVYRSVGRSALFLIPLLIGCLAFSQVAQAVSPPPDGGYAGGNTAEGYSPLLSLTTGTYNTAVGYLSLKALTDGNFNTAIGAGALLGNTGNQNTATGAAALLSNTRGSFNTADGEAALFFNTTGARNTAVGVSALQSNTTGNFNTAVGSTALFSNTTGSNNTANGASALTTNTTGTDNTAIGVNALFSNTTANNNTAIGRAALNHNTTGSIFGQTSSAGTAVFINSDGKLGTATSSRRFKQEIQPMEGTSEVIFALKPVTFRYKKGIDPQGIPQLGLVAEDVEAVNPDLVVRDKNGETYTVRYDAVNAMLLNEFLKEHHQVQDLKAIVAEQQRRIDALTAGLEKVSAPVQLSKPEPQVVLKNR